MAAQTEHSIPTCPTHGTAMMPRTPGTTEQAWCGEWYDCPTPVGNRLCLDSVLIPSEALRAQTREMPGVGR